MSYNQQKKYAISQLGNDNKEAFVYKIATKNRYDQPDKQVRCISTREDEPKVVYFDMFDGKTWKYGDLTDWGTYGVNVIKLDHQYYEGNNEFSDCGAKQNYSMSNLLGVEFEVTVNTSGGLDSHDCYFSFMLSAQNTGTYGEEIDIEPEIAGEGNESIWTGHNRYIKIYSGNTDTDPSNSNNIVIEMKCGQQSVTKTIGLVPNNIARLIFRIGNYGIGSRVDYGYKGDPYSSMVGVDDKKANILGDVQYRLNNIFQNKDGTHSNKFRVYSWQKTLYGITRGNKAKVSLFFAKNN